jgi:hypothetical protein
VESWLHSVLCLDAATHLPRPPAKLPHPSSCELFYVERDTLFSFHKASEAFLQRVGGLGWLRSAVYGVLNYALQERGNLFSFHKAPVPLLQWVSKHHICLSILV